MQTDPAVLEAALGHAFQDRDLLQRALTHKSRAFEQAAGPGDNELLEFLGDSVLGFLVSEALVHLHPHFHEGRLSKLKAHLVSAAHLYQVARELGLGDHLLLGRGEEASGGRSKRTLLSNAVEALIAAVYLDGGLAAAREFVSRHILRALAELEALPDSSGHDYKSALQETAQTLKLPAPRYLIVQEHGPEHSKVFTVEVRVGKDWSAQSDGGSKKSAAQKAAQQLLERLQANLRPVAPPGA
ncbi:MAG: ribonuclease III [Acidobacteria bacterium]|nr:ribonuclease III [Acidobacteriota bacterium]